MKLPDILIVFVIGLVLAVVAEAMAPPQEQRLNTLQRLFRPLVIFVISFVLGVTVTYMETIRGQIDERYRQIAIVVEPFANPEIEAEFQTLSANYHENFGQYASDPLHKWAIAALKGLNEDLEDGFISMPPGEAVSFMATAILRSANMHVLATNVGDVDLFFGSGRHGTSYRAENQSAFKRGVPIVRFYLYRDDINREDLTDFIDRVGVLHNDLNTVYSAVIDIRKAKLSKRDLVLVDGERYGEMLMDDYGQAQRGVACEKPDTVNEAKAYFVSVLDAAPDTTFEMADDDIREQFPAYQEIHEPDLNGVSLARYVAKELVLGGL